jgi:hypothetical protein
MQYGCLCFRIFYVMQSRTKTDTLPLENSSLYFVIQQVLELVKFLG